MLTPHGVSDLEQVTCPLVPGVGGHSVTAPAPLLLGVPASQLSTDSLDEIVGSIGDRQNVAVARRLW
jgi:hypothetical protein